MFPHHFLSGDVITHDFQPRHHERRSDKTQMDGAIQNHCRSGQIQGLRWVAALIGTELLHRDAPHA
jgi:hypothetical protein